MAIEESEGKQAQEVGRCHRFYYARVVSFRADHFRFLVETDCPPPFPSISLTTGDIPGPDAFSSFIKRRREVLRWCAKDTKKRN